MQHIVQKSAQGAEQKSTQRTVVSKTIRILEVLAMLLRDGTTADQVQDRFCVSRRTVFRYFATIRQAGFDIECSNGCYRVYLEE